MTYEKFINEINLIQRHNLISIAELKTDTSKPKTNTGGLYWIWTDFPIEAEAMTKLEYKNKEVPISDLVKRRKELKGDGVLLSQKKKGFYIVYNGYSGTALRKRILQELNCSSENTGTLNLMKKLPKENIEISFIQEDDNEIKELVEQLKENPDLIFLFKNTKAKPADWKIDWEKIEQDWRYVFGVPILCRK